MGPVAFAGRWIGERVLITLEWDELFGELDEPSISDVLAERLEILSFAGVWGRRG